MGSSWLSMFSPFGRKKSLEDPEEFNRLLDVYDKKVQVVKDKRRRTRNQQTRVTRVWVYTVLALYVAVSLYVLSLPSYKLPAPRPFLLVLSAVACFLAHQLFVSFVLHPFYSWRIRRLDARIQGILKQQDTAVSKLKGDMDYEKKKQELERLQRIFDSVEKKRKEFSAEQDLPRSNSASSAKSASSSDQLRRSVLQQQQQQKQKIRDSQPAPQGTKPAPQTVQNAGASGKAAVVPTRADASAGARRSTAAPVGSAIDGQAYARPTVLDRFVDYLTGQHPANCLALICSECAAHNGLMMVEDADLGYKFRCYQCQTVNAKPGKNGGDKVQRMAVAESPAPPAALATEEVDVSTPKTPSVPPATTSVLSPAVDEASASVDGEPRDTPRTRSRRKKAE